MPDMIDEKAKCQHCGSQFDDFTEEAEFIGWHGVCVKCFLSEESNAWHDDDADTERSCAMIDLDEMEMFSKSMIERGIGHMESGASCYEVIDLIEHLRKAEKDAARYRWLLDNCTTQQADSCGPIFVMTIRRNKNPYNVGLSIDEAMNA